MTYRFKISRRLAAAHWSAAVALLAGLLGACQAGEPISAPLTPPPPTSRPTADNDTLALSPASVTLRPGDTVRFRAPDATVLGTAVSGPVEWSATGGTIDQAGLYTATTNGQFEVLARRGGKSGRSTVLATVTLTGFTISPAAASLTPGASAAFTPSASWSNSTSTTPSGVSWTATGGTVDGSGRYTAGSTPGAYAVIGTFQGMADTAAVTISAPAATLTSLVLNPSQIALQFGQSRQFTVAAGWSDGSTSVPPVQWTATGGTVTSSGQFTAPQTAGTYQVIVRNETGTVADTSSVTVSAPTLTALSLTPASATVNPGTTRQFSVSATWSNGTTTVPALAWSATGGTVSSAGLYTAGTTPGSFRVIAREAAGTVADTATITIPVTVTSCAVSPTTATLTYGQTQQFAATVQRSDGTSGAGSATWTATGGTVSSSGLYTAGTVTGRFSIVAAIVGTTVSCAGAADVSAPLTPPSTPTLIGVDVTPGTASLTTGAQQQFSATGRMSDGSSGTVTVSWSASGGSVSSSGLFTAPSSAGTYTVIASQVGGSLRDTAVVTVQSGTVTPPTSGVATWPNEPTGYTVLTPGSTGWEGVTSGTWSSGSRDGWLLKFLDGTRSAQIARPGSSGISEQQTLRHVYPAQHQGGGGVEPYFDVGGDYGRLYVGMYVRLSPNFFGHQASGITKLAYIRTTAPSDAWSSVWFEVTGTGSQPLRPYIVPQLTGGISYIDPSSREVTRGDWHRLEFLYEMAPTARVRYWLDGELVIDRSGIGGPSRPGNRIIEVTLSGILGGIGGTGNPQEQWLEYDRVRISGAP